MSDLESKVEFESVDVERALAERFVGACRYPPLGIRSYGPVRGSLGAGAEHVRRSDETVLTFAMIETADGFANLEDIAATPGLDGLHVGPADLSLALGLQTFADLEAAARPRRGGGRGDASWDRRRGARALTGASARDGGPRVHIRDGRLGRRPARQGGRGRADPDACGPRAVLTSSG